MNEIKAVFFDVDGTLVSFKTHRMPDGTRRALDRLREKGILTFVATGRRMADTGILGDWVPDGYVTLNGSYCVMDGRVIHKRTIDRRDVDALAARLERDGLHPFVILGEDDAFITRPDERIEKMMRLVGMRTPQEITPAAMLEMEVYQMLGFFGEEDESEVMKLLPNCNSTRWTHLFTDIIPAGSNKWAGISEIIGRLGIAPEETMAFGDGGNDIDMLSGAGIGVAMGNAAQEVKRHADYVTTSVDSNGIAKALEYFRIL